jgi:hypothetical protein
LPRAGGLALACGLACGLALAWGLMMTIISEFFFGGGVDNSVLWLSFAQQKLIFYFSFYLLYLRHDWKVVSKAFVKKLLKSHFIVCLSSHNVTHIRQLFLRRRFTPPIRKWTESCFFLQTALLLFLFSAYSVVEQKLP